MPEKVKRILTMFDEVDTYDKCKKIVQELEKIGWSADYDLGCFIFDLTDPEGNVFNLDMED